MHVIAENALLPSCSCCYEESRSSLKLLQVGHISTTGHTIYENTSVKWHGAEIWNIYSVYACTLSCSVMSDSLWPLWTVVCQAPRSMGFSREEYWSGMPCVPPGDLPDPRIKSRSPILQVDSLSLSHWGSPMYSVNEMPSVRDESLLPWDMVLV